MKIFFKIWMIFFVATIAVAQKNYTNPIIHADYSDPDAIRVGDDYYMVSSSFNHIPGLPILHSKDLVHWQLIGHALKKNVPEKYFDTVRNGGGVWAPSIRYHHREFYIYYPDPDFGIYVIKAKNILGPWTEPVLVQAGKGLIDPCPLWDDDGKNYLVHAYAGSRAGIKSILVIKEMNATADKIIGDAVMIYDGHENDPTVEGPKIYKYNNYYYVFAPAGGVSTGWQIVLRSKNIYGPYERKVVMTQGKSLVNGPHQGAWVQTQTGEDWFLHFQDADAYGRIVHLQPMQWKNDWPIIGKDDDGDAIGEPVSNYKLPNIKTGNKNFVIANTDEFNDNKQGLQWQWQANPQECWAYPTSTGMFRMFSVYQQDSTASLWNAPNLFCQKLPAENFTVTTKLSLKLKFEGEKIGLIIFGTDYAYVSAVKKADGNYFSFSSCKNADKGKKENGLLLDKINNDEIYFRVRVTTGGNCSFSYSTDNNQYKNAGENFVAKPGRWVGAKVGLFCLRNNSTNDAGFANIDWFRFEK